MTVSTAALQYLAPLPTAETFWQWSSERDALEWLDGPTIAFRQELLGVLTPLASRGLPPLDVVVLILAACRASWPTDSARLAELERALTLRVRTIAGKWHEDAIRHLQDVHRLPSELRTSLAGKAAIVEMALDRHAVRTTPEEARAILDLLSSAGWMREAGFGQSRIKGIGQWSIELRGLCDGLRRISEETVRLRMKTGLEVVPVPAAPKEVEPDAPPPLSTVTQLIRELREDDEFAGLMRLTRNLTAVVSLPRPIAEPDELSLGGVSDIANRGPLDRLLLSELAHDDDTLMTRIALSEALYLRRETPPTTPPRERVILLDSGLRMWGTPRVYAAAVGLALAAMGERAGAARILRAAGESLVEVDFTTRGGLEQHLAVLDRRLDLSEAIPALAGAVDPVTSETILVTSEAGAADDAVRRLLREHLPVCYVAAVSQEGNFSLWGRSPAGTRLIRRARLDLSALLEPPRHRPAATPLVDRDRSELPGALRLEKFPLLLPCDVPHWRNLLLVGETTSPRRWVILTNDRRLTVWGTRRTGGWQITDRLPRGDVQWFRFDERTGLLELVLGQLAHAELHGLRIDLFQEQVVSSVRFALPQDPVQCVAEHHGLFSIRRGAVDQLDFQTGRVLRTATPPPSVTWSGGRFFKGLNGWYALSGGDRGPHWELLLPRETVGPDFVVTIVDVPEKGGPAAILSSGEILFLVPDRKDPGSARPLSHLMGPDARIEIVDHEGRCVLLNPKGPNGRSRHLIDLRGENLITPLKKDTRQLFDDTQWNQLSQRNLLKRFRSIGSSYGHLTLTSTKGRLLKLTYATEGVPTIRLVEAEPGFSAGKVCHFKDDVTPKGIGYTLSQAEWSDGSRVVLDSRGLLHFQSSDRSIPEFSVVLSEIQVSGWCADGRRWGAEYFHGGPPATLTPDREIWNDLFAPFLLRLP